MHTRIVISVSIVLIIAGALLLKITENISWMGAFFMSVSARTAGFATYSLGTFSKSGLLVIIILMIIGASPGSTGGGIKTSTFLSSYRVLSRQQLISRRKHFIMQYLRKRSEGFGYYDTCYVCCISRSLSYGNI